MRVLEYFKSLFTHNCHGGKKCEFDEGDVNKDIVRRYERIFKPELPEPQPPRCIHCGKPFEMSDHQ